MSRSSKKGPYIDERLIKKVMKVKVSNSAMDIVVTVSNISVNQVEYKSLNEFSYEEFVDWIWISCNYTPFMSLVKKNGCEFLAPSGTVTRVASSSFGALEDREEDSEMEVRASWTPTSGDDLVNHVNAWLELLAISAGLEPIPQGVTSIAGKN